MDIKDQIAEATRKLDELHRNPTLQAVLKSKKNTVDVFRDMVMNSKINLDHAQSDFDKELHEFILLLAVFNYELGYELLLGFQGKGQFVANVHYKNALHKLYEFDLMFSKTYFKKIESLLRGKGIVIDSAKLGEVRRQFAAELKDIGDFRDVRNRAGGHYDPDLTVYLAAIDSVEFQVVEKAANTMTKFISTLLSVLASQIKGDHQAVGIGDPEN
ncbi:hypothetical protein CLU85_4524 [Acidovorax sp. 69]|uniref:hypothetical protein n=1 Tax=Acidovorax sp. 69 TaxID=2035202 RepID=UPI000C246F62|nr:hypothetical protein [Acidovorax sp. 69]PJI99670.1 hypothetical protein CLU85_4524 [Acidovorax sp. 69]